jgi:predicted SnoaL-like aldol condensation-catalyzing enzyme
MSSATAANNKEIVLSAFDALFNKRDYKEAERFWSPEYIQHSAHIAAVIALTKALPASLRYENAIAVAEGDFVILHGRFSGHGLLRNWIVADIVRLDKGILVEHWDVIQDEATATESKSERPMFGASFAE